MLNKLVAGDYIGRYTLVCQIGEGNFGVVWLAEEVSTYPHNRVAIKIIKDSDGDVLSEVFSWAKIGRHPNVLPIIEAKRYDTSRGWFPAIISPFMEEGSVADLIKAKPITTQDGIELICGVLDGLEHLRAGGFVHRDLKPANVLLCEGSPMIADFGLARVAKPNEMGSEIAGTRLYMAPEAFGGVCSHQTDVWSAAVMCYKLLTGRLPFPDEYAIRDSSVSAEPLPFGFPIELGKVLISALRKDRNARCYPSAITLRDALRSACKSSQPQANQPTELLSTTLHTPDPPMPIPQPPGINPFTKEEIVTIGEVEGKNIDVIKRGDRGSEESTKTTIQIEKIKAKKNITIVG